MAATTSYTPTSNSYLNGLLMGTKWASTSLTYSFPSSASFYETPYSVDNEPGNGFSQFTAQQQSATRTILSMFTSVSGLTLTEWTESSTVHADLRYANSDDPSTAWGYYPHTSPAGGDSWYGNSGTTPVRGNYHWATIIHETGHVLGLKHGHETSGGFNAMPGDHDSLEYTIMSYRSYTGQTLGGGYTNGSWDYPTTLMMEDIRALQHLYGANYNTNSGNTTYTWSPTTGEMSINGVGQGASGANRVFMTVWDGGGNDTYDFSNYSTNLVINLGPGYWTTTSSDQLARLGDGRTAVGNIANAYLYNNDDRSLIENAYGGSGNDAIYGNSAANGLTGNGGNDWLYGYGGDDTLIGSAGNDSIDGGAGTDTAWFSGNLADYQRTKNADGSWTIVDLRAGSPDGTDIVRNVEYFHFQDTTWSTLNTKPTVDASNHSARTNSWTRLNTLVDTDDADGNTITLYQIYDPSSSGAFFYSPNGGYYSSGYYHTLTATEFNLSYVVTGTTSGSDTMSIRVFDGTDWSDWDTFTVTTQPNTKPTVTVDNQSLKSNNWVKLDTLVTTGDADGNAITTYQIYDSNTSGSSGYFYNATTGRYTSGYYQTLTEAEFHNTWVVSGSGAGTDSMSIRVFDGTDWSNWDSFTLTTEPNTKPTVTIDNQSVTTNAWTRLSSLVTTGDADGNTITLYQIYDANTSGSSGYFYTSGTGRQTAGYYQTLTATEFNNTWLVGGTGGGSDSMSIRVYDGTSWSDWDSFTFTTQPNTAPTVTADNYAATGNSWRRLSDLVHTSDADGNAITLYQIYDANASGSSGFFYSPNGGYYSAGSYHTLTASEFNLAYVATGSGAGTDTMAVRVFDGTDWSPWDGFTLQTLV